MVLEHSETPLAMSRSLILRMLASSSSWIRFEGEDCPLRPSAGSEVVVAVLVLVSENGVAVAILKVNWVQSRLFSLLCLGEAWP